MEGSGLPGGYQFPPGFRFHPTDQELIIHYLTKKVSSCLPPASSIIADIDLYKFNPWELPDKSFFGEGEWFFFSPRDRKYPNGARPNRAAGCGYWKATGTDKPILAAGGIHCLGVKKALVFYKGRPPKGIKTDWVMHEYRLLDSNTSWTQKHKGTMRLDDWVLCRVRQKGCLPLEAEEKHEGSNLSPPFTIQQAEKATATTVMKTRGADTTFQWSDYQLLAYLMGSSEEAGESGGESSPPGSAKSSGGGFGMGAGGFTGFQQQQQPQQVSSALDSIKRNLSFEALDELMLMPPSKRMNCYSSEGEQPSPTGSVSVEQVYPRFMM